MTTSVREAMTNNPQSVEASTPVLEAAKLLKQLDVGSLPTLDDGRLVGMITDRDIVLRVVAEGKDVGSTTVGEIASTDLIAAGRGTDLAREVRRLPVVEEDGRLVGILAQADVAHEGEDSKTGQLVERISN